MLRKVDKDIFLKAVGSPAYRRSLAFAILLKDRKANSVVRGYSLRRLSEITGISPATCAGHVERLREMGLVREWKKDGVRYLKVSRLRAQKVLCKNGKIRDVRYRNIYIDGIDRKDLGSIERGLMAMLIVDTQSRKDAIKQLTDMASGKQRTGEKFSAASYKRAKKKCSRRGWKVFRDNGFSYAGIARKLHCGLKTVSRVLSYGEGLGLFSVRRYGLIPLALREWDVYSHRENERKGTADYYQEGQIVQIGRRMFFAGCNGIVLPERVAV